MNNSGQSAGVPPEIAAFRWHWGAFAEPAESVMLGDVGTQDDLRTDGPDAYKIAGPAFPLSSVADARPSARHFGRYVDIAFMDGHAKPLSLEEFYTGQAPQDRWFCADPTSADACERGAPRQ